MARVCRPGGKVVVLEFSKTRNAAIDRGFKLYFSRILPLIGRVVTGTRAYSYLSKSVEAFPEGLQFCQLMSQATGAETTARRLSFGIATMYISQMPLQE
jgi:demethylmenaquinone methyltransferase/2-methoxy-6-polyprenyl-1,4-benzoquinol methylase